MIDAAIAIRIGSPYSTLSLVRQTIESIENNFGNGTYRFILSPDPSISADIKKYLADRKRLSPEKFILQEEKTVYWSEFINEAIEAAHNSRYFIISHDDILLHSPNFFGKMVKVLDKKEEKIGWIAFDDISYRHRFWSPPTRTGYFIDSLKENAWEKRTMFQFHNLPPNWWEPSLIRRLPRPIITSLRLGLPIAWKQQLFEQPLSQDFLRLLDIPKQPVKCHTCWNNFVVIKTKVLEDLGMCEHWQTYNALLVDEDWGLRAMKKKYWNIWIPSLQVEHIHSNVARYGNRSQGMIAIDSTRVHGLFKKKWGFSADPDEKELLCIQKNHKNTLIPWSSTHYSYEWECLK